MDQTEITKTIGNYELVQRRNDGFVNATYLTEQFNRANNENRMVKEFLNTDEAQSIIRELTGSYMDQDNGKFFEQSDSGGIWIHPGLILHFAKWIDARLELEVIKWFHKAKKEDIKTIFNH